MKVQELSLLASCMAKLFIPEHSSISQHSMNIQEAANCHSKLPQTGMHPMTPNELFW
jgi:hypothetical protein